MPRHLCHRGELVRDYHRPRRGLPLGTKLRERVHDRGEVRPRVGQEVLHTPLAEQLQVGLGHRLDLNRLEPH